MSPRVVLLVAGLFLLTACSSGGTTSAADGTPGVSGISPERPASLDGVDPCTLIDDRGRAALGITTAPHNGVNVSATRSCGWLLGDDYYATVSLFTQVGLDDLALPAGTTATSVGGRAGKKIIKTADPGCSLYLAATAHSAVQIDVDQGKDAEIACYDALKVAFLADGRLPATP
ncbi:DUF3558 family protein [Kutzneria kofuensis]|uniref:DUF3558 domain-containing protein n=1 Tax=Kutzneria kofuensis TaxID=103725 RepID=A0A7W9KGK4_9PSEU|nr:DUF3558 family protein [Kutzneria kofuensis]MBB5892213.1 hypothetical protein [Kutzneria kofuensis]